MSATYPAATHTPTPTSTPSGTPAFGHAEFVYDGDGKRVRSALTTGLGTTTTYFAGNYYEVTGSTVTKYYYAGSQRIAMRQGGNLYYLLSDHLGSTSLTTNSSGNVVSELRYSAWGEIRSSSGTTPTDYTFTAQYSNTPDFGLMYYGTRWYDPYLNHFTQPDAIVPDPYNPQDWDRFSYVRNNPIRYNDPSGHWPNLIGSYILGWTNFGAAVSILQHPNATVAEKVMAGGYVAVWGGAHAALAVGATGLACGLVAGCAATAEAALGIGGTASADGDPTNEISAITESAKSVTDKLSRYLLNPEHADGSSKAEWFKQALGYTKENMADLAKQIVFNPETAKAVELTRYGQKYEQVINLIGANGKSIDVLFVWIRNADGVVRLVTSIPTKK